LLTPLKIILPVLIYQCGASDFTLRGEYGVRVFHNKMLRKMFGRKREEVTREWRRLHRKEFHDLYPFPNIIWENNQGE
jgi:hypothetical protein